MIMFKPFMGYGLLIQLSLECVLHAQIHSLCTLLKRLCRCRKG